jgi:serine/threonine-protein kinase
MNELISVSSAMEAVVSGCMAKDPEQRFRTMDEVLAALKRVGGIDATASTGGLASAPYNSLLPMGSVSRPVDSSRRDASPMATPLDSAPVPRRRASKPVFAAGLILALAAIGALVYGRFRPRAETPVISAPSASAASATGPTAGTSAETVVPAPALVTPPVQVRVSTDPDGATVKEDGVELCSTPCDIFYKGKDADPEREHKLTLARQGYRVETRSLKVGESSALHVKLVATPRAPPPPRVADAPAAVPTGYKTEIPY